MSCEQVELGHRQRRRAAPVRRVGGTSSTSVFHAPHPVHWPVHLGCPVPQSVHAWTVLILVMAVIMTRGCAPAGGASAGSGLSAEVRPDRAGQTRRCRTGSSGRLGEDLLGDGHRRVGGGDAGVAGGVHDDLGDLVVA